MLLWNLDLLLSQPLYFFLLLLVIAVALGIAITFHEASHALAAARLGDATARQLGRLSLNPLRHLDPLGTLMLFLVGFGWGKPVPVNAYSLRGGWRSGMAKVASAGPLSNLVVALAFALPVRLGALEWHSPLRYGLFEQLSPEWIAADLVGMIIFYNLILAIFNLIPIAPLDGFNIALGLLPRDLAEPLARSARYGIFILLAIIALDYLVGINILWWAIKPVIDFFALLFVGARF